MTQPVPPPVPPPQPAPVAGAREDQAAVIAAQVATVMAATEIAIIASVAATVRTVTIARHAVLHAGFSITRKLGHSVATILAHGHDQAVTVIHQHHHDPVLAARVSDVITRANHRAAFQAQNAFTTAVRAAAAGGTPGGGEPPGPRHLTLPSGEDAYRRATREAVTGTRGGMPVTNTSYSALQAAQKALDNLGKQGITGYTDRAGRRWSLPSYVEMATRTTISDRYDELNMQALANSGIDCVWTYTDSSEGSCPRCLPWLNKALSISGFSSFASVRLADGSRFTRPIAGTLAEAKAAGFRHPSCRCGITGLWDGIDLAALGHGAEPLVRSPATYKASQHQRELERRVRAAARAAASAVTPQAKRAARTKLAAARAASAAHRQQHGLRMTKVAVRRRESPHGPPGGPAK